MKNRAFVFTKTVLLLIVIVSVFIPDTFVSAQFVPFEQAEAENAQAAARNDPALAEQRRQEIDEATARADAIRATETDFDCGIFGSDNLMGCLAWITYYLYLSPMAWIAGKSGEVFDFALKETVIEMREKVGGVGGGERVITAINDGWRVIRDLSNLAFIFIILYIAISLIIRGSSFNFKEMLRNVIIAALLINFSFFLTAIFIDVTNVLAISFHDLITVNGQKVGDEIAGGGNSTTNVSIAGAFIGKLKLSTLGDLEGTKLSENESVQVTLKSIFGGTALLILGIVFLVAVIFLLVRFITLVILLIFSPAAFLGIALPQIKSAVTDPWLKYLTGQGLFAPVFLLMLFITFAMINTSGEFFNIGDGSWSELFASIGGNNPENDRNAGISLLFTYMLTIAFIIASLAVAKKVATDGAELSGKAATFLGGAAAGAVGFAGRQTLGRTGKAIANSERLQESAKRSAIARTALKASRGVAGGSYDARASRPFKGVATATGVNFGKAGGKGGFGKKFDNKVQKQKDFVAGLDLTEDEQIAYAQRFGTGALGNATLFATGGGANYRAAREIGGKNADIKAQIDRAKAKPEYNARKNEVRIRRAEVDNRRASHAAAVSAGRPQAEIDNLKIELDREVDDLNNAQTEFNKLEGEIKALEGKKTKLKKSEKNAGDVLKKLDEQNK